MYLGHDEDAAKLRKDTMSWLNARERKGDGTLRLTTTEKVTCLVLGMVCMVVAVAVGLMLALISALSS